MWILEFRLEVGGLDSIVDSLPRLYNTGLAVEVYSLDRIAVHKAQSKIRNPKLLCFVLPADTTTLKARIGVTTA